MQSIDSTMSGVLSLLNHLSTVTISAIGVGLILQVFLPKKEPYFEFDIENRFLPREHRDDGTLRRHKFEIRRIDVLLAGILFAGFYVNRRLTEK